MNRSPLVGETFMNILEIIGIVLIACGIIYTFLRGMGKISDTDDAEIESKILKIKGGPGLILIAFGIILFTVGNSQPLIDIIDEIEEPPKEPEFLLGEWMAITEEYNDVIMFHKDGNFESITTFGGDEKQVSGGSYQFINSELELNFEIGGRAGTKLYVPMEYIGQNTFELGGVIYERIE